MSNTKDRYDTHNRLNQNDFKLYSNLLSVMSITNLADIMLTTNSTKKKLRISAMPSLQQHETGKTTLLCVTECSYQNFDPYYSKSKRSDTIILLNKI